MRAKNYDHLLSHDLQKIAKIGREGAAIPDGKKLAEFWIEYAKYLEKNNLISPSRVLLYDMALATATRLMELES